MKTASPKTSEARRIIVSPASSALGVLAAAKELIGDCWHWEPESIWLALEQLGLDIPVENRARLQAAITLYLVPSFYWDGIVFEKTAMSFAGHQPNSAALEEPDITELAWAVEEAAQIVKWHGDAAWNFSHEPIAYAAVVLHRDGYVLCPASLSFAQNQLNGLNCKDVPEDEACPAEPIRNETEKAWAAVDKESMLTHAFPETRVGVQCARLATVYLYCKERRLQLETDLAALTS